MKKSKIDKLVAGYVSTFGDYTDKTAVECMARTFLKYLDKRGYVVRKSLWKKFKSKSN